MKGIILYEDYRGKKVVEAIKLGEVDYTCKSASSDDGWINELSGIRMTSTQAYCNKDDTYDFETGALIALMKMCGRDKVIKACDELYNNTDMIFCGGRQNGKQFTLLVDLFKKLDQKKVDAAYKEAYNTTLPVWQKEVLKQMYDIYADKLIKPPTKREEMWEKIFALHKENDVIIKVKKEDVNTFLHEIENKIPEITWASGVKIFETKHTIGDIYEELKTCDIIYFRLWKETKLSYSSDSYIYQIGHNPIDYLPPMRWDLFKKGRIAVRLTKDNYKEFYDICEKELGRSPSYKPDEFAYAPMEKYILKYNKKFKGYTFLGSTESDKIVNWEDVR